MAEEAELGCAYEAFEDGDGEACADAAFGIDVLGGACLDGDLLYEEV